MKRAVRVKMCGLVRRDDVGHAVALGVDYVGFVFVPGGPRTLSPEAAERLLTGLDTGNSLRVGVFRDAPATFINEIVARCNLDRVQLHGHEPRDFPSAVTVPVLRSMRVQATLPAGPRPEPRLAAALPLPPNVEALLLDPEDAAGRSGGLGLRADPAAIASALALVPPGTRLFLSGGLTPDNVAATARTWKPFAVDVSSGIESEPGRKDAGRMAAFVAALEARP